MGKGSFTVPGRTMKVCSSSGDGPAWAPSSGMNETWPWGASMP
jgi:hypothetical protein